jgi:DNA-binding transcriptional ArsR family regulator
MFRALGDPARLLLMECLIQGERCVGDLALFFGQEVSTISQRLKVLRNERLIERRREGKHIFYYLADEHVTDLIRSALVHAQHQT